MSAVLLEVRNLTKVFLTGGFIHKRMLKAVNDVSFSIPRDKPTIITLAGESGSGKSTIGRLIIQEHEPTSGNILYQGKDIREMSKGERRSYIREVQMVYQDPYSTYNPFYIVDRILKMPLRNFKLASSQADEGKMIRAAIEAVNLSPERVLGKYPHQLSGGERQRLMVARALMLKPRIIIADEPVSMIDASLRAGILNDIQRLKDEFDVSFLYITHDLSTAYTISQRMIILYRGSIVEDGDIEKVINSPRHPYLQKLIDSIPLPDPEMKWKEKLDMRTEEITYKTEGSGCKYYGRCPKAMDRCAKDTPRLSDIESNHKVACHIYA